MALRKRYPRVAEGQWVYPRRRGYRMMCCDCGLVHVLNFKLEQEGRRGKRIAFQAFRDQRATAASRRKRTKVRVQ